MRQPDNRKPAHESWESFTERRIREAQEAGEFDQLPGFGKPIPGIDQPLDENWWVKEKLKREQINALPPTLEVRLEIQKTLEQLDSFTNEYALRRRLEALNEKVKAANYSHIRGPADGVLPVDVERVVQKWHESRSPNSHDCDVV